jgi:hypothetical protein
MSVRAKFVLNSVTFYGDPTIQPDCPRDYNFGAQYDMSIPEDRRFQKATPWGEFKMRVDNPLVFPHFKTGKAYYLDLTPVPEEPKP